MPMTTIADLKPDPRNARKHGLRNLSMITKSLEEVGAARSIVIDENNVILAGNGLVEAAGQLGIENVQIVDVDGDTIVAVRRKGLAKAQKKRLAVLDNRAGELAEWEPDVLAELNDEGLLDGLFFEEELNALLDGILEPEGGLLPHVDPDDIPTDVETRCKRGDLWQLGRHRLLCGDCRVVRDIAALFADQSPRTVITSPPYFNQREYAQWQRYEDYICDMVSVIDGLPSPVLVCWNVGDSVPEHLDIPADTSVAFTRTGFEYIDKIIWRKPGGVFDCPRNGHIARQLYYPAFAWEPILIFRKGDHPKFDKSDTDFLNANNTNVWEIETVQTNAKEHSAAYPVELPMRLIRAYSQTDDIIYDPFLGSGTTLIAAEQENRICYGMEIEPKYCDVILTRWENATGRQAELINGTTT